MLRLFLLLFVAAAAADLNEEFAGIARRAARKVGATAILIETGERISFHGGDHFPMQSVYKFPIAMATLHLADAGAIRLDQEVPVAKSDLVPAGLHSPIRDQHPEGTTLSVRELVHFAVGESDGTASDVLLRLAGGPGKVTRYLRDLGIRGVVVATTEAEMSRGPMVQYRNWGSPDSLAALLVAFHAGRGLSAPMHRLLDEAMAESTPGPKRIKGLLPAGTRVAHKTGTSSTEGKLTRATNDVGIATLPNGRHIAMAVLISDSTATQDVREQTIAEIARAAWNHWR